MPFLIRTPFVAASLLLSTTSLPGGFTAKPGNAHFPSSVHTGKKVSAVVAEKYASWQLEKQGISMNLFAYAMKGYEYLSSIGKITNKNVLTLIDFSQPSSVKRLFVLDTETGAVIFKTLVAHGRNSGKEWATNFSNTASSFASSLDFYTTADIYNGVHGISLRLNGCEKGFNDNASKRAVVMHGADYVSETFIAQNGYLGRSLGCPAVPVAFSNKIINVIKGGSCMFIYAPSKRYLSLSAILNS